MQNYVNNELNVFFVVFFFMTNSSSSTEFWEEVP